MTKQIRLKLDMIFESTKIGSYDDIQWNTVYTFLVYTFLSVIRFFQRSRHTPVAVNVKLFRLYVFRTLKISFIRFFVPQINDGEKRKCTFTFHLYVFQTSQMSFFRSKNAH